MLTCLQHIGEEKSDTSSSVEQEENGAISPKSSEPLVLRDGLFVTACASFDRANNSCQRWGIKQEKWSTFGQWRHSCVNNPEWHKKALIWPLDRDGEPNESLIWPIEGQLVPFAPPLNPVRGQPGSQTGMYEGINALLFVDTCDPFHCFVLNSSRDSTRHI